jgi:mitosis inhibitor protein kinase SWE1
MLNHSPSRLRLREEVDALKHLSRAAQAVGLVGGTHPNVLGYVDSWEQDEQLFIRTELCELGNLARFLWEFGRVCPRLDEGRVWKIFAELSSVCLPVWIGRGSVLTMYAGPLIHSR